MIIGIDPGLSGAIAIVHENKFTFHLMPLEIAGKSKDVDMRALHQIMEPLAKHRPHVYLERAMPFAMGALSAFNYGRGFRTLELVISMNDLAVTYVEPAKWAKAMHEGIHDDLKPKAKSEIAVRRLFPKFICQIPKSRTGKLHDGVIDALLIAGYGLRRLKTPVVAF